MKNPLFENLYENSLFLHNAAYFLHKLIAAEERKRCQGNRGIPEQQAEPPSRICGATCRDRRSRL